MSKAAILKELAERAAKGDALAMDHASRMDRARAMGFDLQLKHASNTVFAGSPGAEEARQAGLDVAEQFNKARGGTYFAPEGDADLPSVIFGTDNPFAGQAEYMVRSGNHFNANYKAMSDEQKDELREVLNSVIDEDDIQEAAGLADVDLEDADPFEVLTDGDFFHYYGRDKQNDVMEALNRRGYDSVTYPDSQAMGDMTQSTVVFDPANIRSVNAAFDPAKADSPNLLAGVGGLAPAAGLAGLAGIQSNESMAAPYTAAERLSLGRPSEARAARFPALHGLANAIEGFRDPTGMIVDMRGAADYLRQFGEKGTTSSKILSALGAPPI